MADGDLLRLSAFTDDPRGGNPAGVWIGGDGLPTAEEMQRIAADVGYSETAFLAPSGASSWTTRYYSPLAEVSFCGHATIAAGVALAGRLGAGRFALDTTVGVIEVRVAVDERGAAVATLRSVEPRVRPCDDGVVEAALGHLGWSADALDPRLPPAIAYAGAWHLVLPLADRATLAALDYDVEGLGELMAGRDLTTVQIVWREDATTFHARNPFPPGGVVEDPATGAAAAALGGYLRASGHLDPPADLVVHQGVDMGRPSLLRVHVPVTGGIDVSGRAVPIVD